MTARASRMRVAVGAAAAAVFAASAGLLVLIDHPGLSRTPVSVSALPPAAPSVATCSGSLLAIGRDSTDAARLTTAARQNVTGATPGGATPAETRLAVPDVSRGEGPVVVTAEPTGGRRTDLAAAGSSRVRASDLAGFAASACTRAAMESWLAGGAATTGAADLVVLANPGAVAAEVTLTLYGADGASTPPAGTAVVVPAATQRVIPLAALALGEESPVIRVTSSQAPVAASLQASLVRVLEPGGVDQVEASTVPADELVIPGVPVVIAPGSQGDDADPGDAGATDVPASLRLLAPGHDGEATVTVLGAKGPVRAPQTVPLREGVPLQLDLDGLPVGTYAVHVTATTPVTGAVRATTGFGAGSDFGWYTGADVLEAPSLVAVAQGPSPSLSLVGGNDDTSVTLAADAGSASPRTVAVPARATVTVPVSAGEVYRIDPGDAGVRAAVSFSGAGALAGYTAQAGDDAASAVRVYPR